MHLRSIKNKWIINKAQMPNGEIYTGELNIINENEAWKCRWLLKSKDAVKYTGYGFFIHNFFIASRSYELVQHRENNSVGLVIYDIPQNGTLPAKWYHPDLKGKIGKGISTNGPDSSLTGNYTADYETAANDKFETLEKKVQRDGDVYTILWLLNKKTIYKGVGMRFGNYLVVGWAIPEIPVEIIKYNVCNKGEIYSLSGKWTKQNENKLGYEILT